ncbi:Arylsulfatase I [Thelohanellus kitauei]|uniref:Arylsulfatase I n=1 Tax=Thelohanellus kitauei TaxID=669202 RepID=A0A0C2MFT0_THEKT|nr:Arylsulfatase I [Thelohanellus kitauei]
MILDVWCDWFSNTKRSIGSDEKPNIIIISTTELGWDDISLHGNPLAVTPNLDTFARHGVTLNNHYISPFEFPTRVEFMTGKYAACFGLNRDVNTNSLPISLPSIETTLPKILKQQGYNTHFLGKWGLGFYKRSVHPINQGFDSFYGSMSFRAVDYYNLTSTDGNYTGYDLYNGTQVVSP